MAKMDKKPPSSVAGPVPQGPAAGESSADCRWRALHLCRASCARGGWKAGQGPGAPGVPCLARAAPRPQNQSRPQPTVQRGKWPDGKGAAVKDTGGQLSPCAAPGHMWCNRSQPAVRRVMCTTCALRHMCCNPTQPVCCHCLALCTVHCPRGNVHFAMCSTQHTAHRKCKPSQKHMLCNVLHSVTCAPKQCTPHVPVCPRSHLGILLE
jgi:hypothetical protein